MTEPSKKISRRDAIKLLGAAAGASVLATLPTKWTKPEITAGVLPAHAQTSACYDLVIEFTFAPTGGTISYSGGSPAALPAADLGSSNPFTSTGIASGSWSWYCGSLSTIYCFSLSLVNPFQDNNVTLTSRDGTVLTFTGGGIYDFNFIASTGTVEVGAC